MGHYSYSLYFWHLEIFGIGASLGEATERENLLDMDRVAAGAMKARRGINLPAWRTILSNNPKEQFKQNSSRRKERVIFLSEQEETRGILTLILSQETPMNSKDR